jgi:hypothetical protein
MSVLNLRKPRRCIGQQTKQSDVRLVHFRLATLCCPHYELTNSTEKNPSWEANRSSASKEIPCTFRNPKVHYCIHTSPPLFPVLSQINPVQAPHPISWKSILILYSAILILQKFENNYCIFNHIIISIKQRLQDCELQPTLPTRIQC